MFAAAPAAAPHDDDCLASARFAGVAVSRLNASYRRDLRLFGTWLAQGRDPDDTMFDMIDGLVGGGVTAFIILIHRKEEK